MAFKHLRIYLASLLVALSVLIGGIAPDAAASGVFIEKHQFAQSPVDTIDYLKGAGHPGIVQSSLQNQLVRPGRTAFGKNETPLRFVVQNAFCAEARPVNGFVLHVFRSQSSFLVENEHSSRAPPCIPA